METLCRTSPHARDRQHSIVDPTQSFARDEPRCDGKTKDVVVCRGAIHRGVHRGVV